MSKKRGRHNGSRSSGRHDATTDAALRQSSRPNHPPVDERHDSLDATGELILIASPIGNLEDIAYRAVRLLGEVDIVAAEDTRRARKLLSHYDVSAKLISYHAHNERRKTASLIDMVRNGTRVAVISDAGTPGIADPGFLIVREAVKANVAVTAVPGPSALTYAAAVSGLPIDAFAFYGYVPVKSGRRTAFFERVAKEDKTVFFFETPHRIHKTLDAMAATLPGDSPIAIVREATKIHEQVLRGTISEILERWDEVTWKGEFVVGVTPPGKR